MKFQGRTSRGNSPLRCWFLGLLDCFFFYPWSAHALPGDTVVEVWLSGIRKHSYSWNTFVLYSKLNLKVTTAGHANSKCIFVISALLDLYLALRCLSFLFTKELCLSKRWPSFFCTVFFWYEGFGFFLSASTMHLKALTCALKALYPNVRALPLFWRALLTSRNWF